MKRAYTLYIAMLFGAGFLLTLYAGSHRVLANTYTVTTTADSGAGSLRQAIMDGNANPGLDTIEFNIGTGTPTITPLSPLPIITDSVIINGNTGGATRVELNGSSAGSGATGLDITAGGSTVRNMVINRFPNNGILLRINGGNTIEGNYIGTNATGSAALANFDGLIINDATSNTIGGTAAGAGNVISGNTRVGVLIANTTAIGNQVLGNYIGTNAAGTAALANFIGVFIDSAPGNTIGDTSSGARNVISGNTTGVRIVNSTATGNQVLGNYIGTNAAGTAALANGTGVLISAPSNFVGGAATGARNVISSNNDFGVIIVTSNSTGNQVLGNYIGTNAAGTSALANGYGVYISSAPSNTVGGTAAGAGNVISGNTIRGVVISGSAATDNQVLGNYIGTNADGTAALANQIGVQIEFAPSNTIGGTTAGARNVISGNNTYGVSILGSGAPGNQVLGNYIGTNAAGTAALANGDGVSIDSAPSNTIGGTAAGASNVISGNMSSGVLIISGATGNQVLGNFIGTNAAGTAGIFNSTGVRIQGGPSNTIGGTAAGARNVISGNSDGVSILGSTATGNQVLGNYIGTNTAGTAALPNSRGIFIDSAPSSTIGGTAAGAGNVISGNLSTGVFIFGVAATGNQVLGNYIGTNAAGTAALANNYGVLIDFAPSNTIGGTAAGAGNIISGNTQNGILISSTTGNQVLGNYVGTNAAGTAAVANGSDGLHINLGSNNQIGGTTTAARNVISGNGARGVLISLSSGNQVQGNFIGTDATGTGNIGNIAAGVRLELSSNNNLIGGTAMGAGNVIAFNSPLGNGVTVASGTGNRIVGNSIYSNAVLGIDLADDGVTPNDACDADAGPNNFQNFPVITMASTTVQGFLNSTANTTFALDFYSSLTPDPSTFGEGQTYRGSTTVTTDALCNATFNLTFMSSVPAGHWITATATDPGGNTSEFSQAAQVLTPTAVELNAFNAKAYDSGVLLEWQTGYEVDNLGFNIYREESGKRALVNSQILAGSALATGPGTVIKAGQSYVWWDGAASSKSAVYWLESVDLNGQSSWHGPISAKIIGGTPPSSSNAAVLSRVGVNQSGLSFSVDRPLRLARQTAEQSAAQVRLAGGAAIKISVKREGWYRVSATELLSAGWNPNADPRLLQLYADGQQLPMGVTTDKDGNVAAIEFYGRGVDAAFTDSRVYWLIAGTQSGQRVQQVKEEGYPTAARSFLSTVERKDRTIYFSSLRNGEQENFFGAVVAAQPVEQGLALQHVDASAAGQATLEVALQGVTTLHHRVWAYLNGQFAGEIDLEGPSHTVAKLPVSHSLLKEGENQVKLVAQGGGSDVSLIDYIRISYYHSFTADNDSLRFTAPGKQAVTIGEFTTGSIRVLDVTNPDSVQEIVGKIERQKTGYAITVTSPEQGERSFVAFTDDQARNAANVAANVPSSLRSSSHAASFVIITRREFAPSLEPLKMMRVKHGYKVEIVDIEDIFDEFSFGNKSPQAIKDFLQYATANWKQGPKHLLIVGDASFDPKNYLGYGDSDYVPTKLVDTSLMETASDDWVADFNGDGVAEIAVGRLPARTAEEATKMVQKIARYEQAQPAESVMLVADSNDGYDFEATSEQLRALVPANVRMEQINRGRLDAAKAKTQLIEAIQRGAKIVNYSGHGSVNLWRGNLLTNEDIELMNSDHQSLFVMMTCLNGYFQDPALESLAESLMKAPAGGAIGVWASSGMTGPVGQALMNQQLYRLLFSGGTTSMSLGEATARAKSATDDANVRRTWIFFGDPTMRLK